MTINIQKTQRTNIMKKQLFTLMAAAVMAIGAQANDSIATTTVKTDTVVNTKDRKIVVSEDGDMIKVSVFKNDSTGMRMVKETTFTDGQEVEQVYVSSPFLPNTWNARGKNKFNVHLPDFFFNSALWNDSRLSFGNSNALHTRNTKSYEIGLTLINANISFNASKTFGIGMGVQYVFTHHHLDKGWTMTFDGNRSELVPIEEGEVKNSYISYQKIKLPVILEWQTRLGTSNHEMYIGAGASLEARFNELSRYKTEQGTVTPSKNLKMNPMGVNAEFYAGYNNLMVTMSVGLTPLFKKGNAPECYTTSIGLGVIL